MDTNNVRPPKPPIPPIQPEAKIEDFVIGGVKYREIELTSDILPLFDRVDCDDIMHQNDSNSDNCRAKKNILIGLAGGYWRLFHRDAADENKLKGSVKLLSTAPAGVDMQKLASEDQGLAELELWWLRSTLRVSPFLLHPCLPRSNPFLVVRGGHERSREFKVVHGS